MLLRIRIGSSDLSCGLGQTLASPRLKAGTSGPTFERPLTGARQQAFRCEKAIQGVAERARVRAEPAGALPEIGDRHGAPAPRGLGSNQRPAPGAPAAGCCLRLTGVTTMTRTTIATRTPNRAVTRRIEPQPVPPPRPKRLDERIVRARAAACRRTASCRLPGPAVAVPGCSLRSSNHGHRGSFWTSASCSTTASSENRARHGVRMLRDEE